LFLSIILFQTKGFLRQSHPNQTDWRAQTAITFLVAFDLLWFLLFFWKSTRVFGVFFFYKSF